MRLFGTSGIRGEFGKKITPELAVSLGKALGEFGAKKVAIGKDTRLTGNLLQSALFSGLMSMGCEILDFNTAPTPVLSYGTQKRGQDAGVMITASHNPSNYNGFKLWDSEGMAFSQEKEHKIESILETIQDIELDWSKVSSEVEQYDVASDYTEDVLNRFSFKDKSSRVLIDAANGAAFGISPLLLTEFGFDVVSVNTEADGTFPNRLPEPSPANLAGTAETLKKENCDLGFCHDGDADRMMVIDDTGQVVQFDKFLAFLCKKSIEESGNSTVVTTVDASMLIEDVLEKQGNSKVIRTRVGDVFVANSCKKHNACFGGEPSGSYIFPDFGLWPDGIFGIFKTLSFIEDEKMPISKILGSMPEYEVSRIKLACENEFKEQVMENIASAVPESADILTIDGVRMSFGDAAVLIRPSGTEPYIRITAEARSKERLNALVENWNKKVSGEIKKVRG